jgi:hypothetical protein
VIFNLKQIAGSIVFTVFSLGIFSEASANNFKLNTMLEFKEEYSSNIYLTETDREADFTSRFSPGLAVAWDTPKSYINAFYKLNILEYSFPRDEEFREEDDDYAIWSDLKFEAGTHTSSFFGKRLYVDVSERFLQNDDPHRVERGFLTGRDEYFINRVAPQIRYVFGEKFQLKLKYLYEVLNYRERGLEDSREHRLFMVIQYRLNSKNWLDTEYQYAERIFDISQDYRLHQGWLKFHHIFNSYLEGELGGGYQYRDYTAGIVDDWEGFTVMCSLEAATGNDFKSRLTYQYLPNTIGMSVFYEIHRLDLYLLYNIRPDVQLRLDPYLQKDFYKEPDKRNDLLLGVSGSLRYKFFKDWFVEVGYRRQQRRSNLSGFDYHEYAYFLSLGLDYEVL